jgi:hypothetical protein
MYILYGLASLVILSFKTTEYYLFLKPVKDLVRRHHERRQPTLTPRTIWMVVMKQTFDF